MRHSHLIPVLLLLAACSGQPKSISSSQSPVPARADSKIGMPDNNGVVPTVVTVDAPNDPKCKPKYTQIVLPVFQDCLVEGLTFSQVSNVFGMAGKLQSQTGKVALYQWSDHGGVAIVQFTDGHLVSKSQSGLAKE